ncbi:MAG: hypothetical protein ACRC4M_04525, partial [Mycoplasma sp.]
MLLDLNWDNYLELNEFVQSHNFKEKYFSPIVLVSWRYYDIYFKFHKTDDFVILYIKFGESHTDQQKDWSISTCFYPESFDL